MMAVQALHLRIWKLHWNNPNFAHISVCISNTSRTSSLLILNLDHLNLSNLVYWKVSMHMARFAIRWSLKSLPNPTILWFYKKTTALNYCSVLLLLLLLHIIGKRRENRFSKTGNWRNFWNFAYKYNEIRLVWKSWNQL